MCVRKLQPNSCSSCSEQTEQQVPPQSAPSPAVDLLGYFTTSVIYEGVCAGRLEDADLPSRSHSDGLNRQETVGIQVETSNQVTIQMLSVSVPANHRYASSNVLHVKLRFLKMSYIIAHITCSSSSSSAGDRSSRQIPAVTRRQKT